jgi:hypothetical protein
MKSSGQANARANASMQWHIVLVCLCLQMNSITKLNVNEEGHKIFFLVCWLLWNELSESFPARQTLHMQFNITRTHQNWMPGGAGPGSWLCDLLSGFQNVPTSSFEGVDYSCSQEMNQRDD